MSPKELGFSAPSLPLPSSLLFIWAKYVHRKVNSPSLTEHKLRMTRLARLPYMGSGVFQYTLLFAKFMGRKTPCMRGRFSFFRFFFPSFLVRHSQTIKKLSGEAVLVDPGGSFFLAFTQGEAKQSIIPTGGSRVWTKARKNMLASPNPLFLNGVYW